MITFYQEIQTLNVEIKEVGNKWPNGNIKLAILLNNIIFKWFNFFHLFIFSLSKYDNYRYFGLIAMAAFHNFAIFQIVRAL